MELTGHLGDFPLTDILQILSLSCKTGTLILRGENGERGMLVFIRGKIVQATTDSILYSLGEILVQQGVITDKILDEMIEVQNQLSKPRLLGSLLVERGAVGRDFLLRAIKQQIQGSIAELLSWKKGSFEIKLNAIPIGRGLPYITQDYVYTEGLNIEELLIEATRVIDESRRDQKDEVVKVEPPRMRITPKVTPEESLLGLDDYVEPLRPTDEFDNITTAESAIQHLKYLLEELKQQSFQGEISLLIMRLASEVCSRGVLFLVKDKEVAGLGQFGLAANGISPDKWVRGISIPLGAPSILNRVVSTCKTQIAAIDISTYDAEIIKRIGGENLSLTAFGIPLILEGKVRVILYGDNYPGDRGIGSLDELEILISQAGLLMEKLLLEQRLQSLRDKIRH